MLTTQNKNSLNRRMERILNSRLRVEMKLDFNIWLRASIRLIIAVTRIHLVVHSINQLSQLVLIFQRIMVQITGPLHLLVLIRVADQKAIVLIKKTLRLSVSSYLCAITKKIEQLLNKLVAKYSRYSNKEKLLKDSLQVVSMTMP